MSLITVYFRKLNTSFTDLNVGECLLQVSSIQHSPETERPRPKRVVQKSKKQVKM